jgi:tripartite ATP-independent transporter DctM subunit
MSAELVGFVSVLALLVLIVLRVPVAVSLGLVGFVGYAVLEGWSRASLALGGVPVELASAYGLSVVPLFALMGALATSAGLSRDLFRGANVVFGRTRGALAMAAIAASAVFGAVCGSSVATAATMGRVSIPEMLHFRYAPKLAAGAVAAGGTLGILIPPSLILMIYAIIARQSVAELFAAALIPGVILTVLYVIVVAIVVRTRPDIVPPPERVERRESAKALLKIWHVVLLFSVTLGGIYAGWFTPTEAAAIGALGALVLALGLRRIEWRAVPTCFTETVRIVSSLTLIVMASTLFSYFIVQTGISKSIVTAITDLGLPPIAVMALICVFYIVLGSFLEGIGMVLVTVPIILPIVLATGFDPVWFGVLLVIVIEIGLVTPPVGMNLFVIRAVSPEVSIADLYRGVLPFLAAPIILIALMLAFPELATWLPKKLG